MLRDPGRLARDTFDAVVVGGGVYGLACAWELSSRGLRVALLERGDFGAATSFNSLKTVHGGIRALQHGSIGEMREFVRERRAIATIAPHLVRPLPFVVPTYRHPVRNRAAMALFFAAYDRLAADRNAGVDPSRALPRSRTVGRADCLRLNPAIDPAGVTGGAIWHDYQLHSPERFALALLASAVAAGAAALNHADATAILVRSGAVEGVRVRDRLTGGDFDVRAPLVVNAAGPWAWAVLANANCVPASVPPPRFSLAMNLVLNYPALSHAVGGVVGGRFLFMVPWRDRSIVGTSHDPFDQAAGERLGADERLVDALLADGARAFPRAGVSRRAVTLIHRGLLPAGPAPGSLSKQSIVHDHAADGLRGLLTVVGVRYTTARATAELTGNHAVRRLGRPAPPSRTAVTPLAGGAIENVARYEREQSSATKLPAALVSRLIAAYGTGYTDVTRLIAADPSLQIPLSYTCLITRAEIAHAVRGEMAVHLSDALLRRTAAGAGGHPGSEAVGAAADVMADILAWPPDERQRQIEAFDDFYR
jgi:glycerol-3-phosphate dehydrogenase